MASLTIELPDDLARSLAGIAAAQNKSLQEVALEQLTLLVEGDSERPGSARAILRAMKESPHLSELDVDELEASIAAGPLQS